MTFRRKKEQNAWLFANLQKPSAPGSADTHLAPVRDAIWIPETPSSVFVCTRILDVLADLGGKCRIITSRLTDPCVDPAVRDVCDFGCSAIRATDPCATRSPACQAGVLANNRGGCREPSTDASSAEFAAFA